jgi:hypothetical protein
LPAFAFFIGLFFDLLVILLRDFASSAELAGVFERRLPNR